MLVLVDVDLVWWICEAAQGFAHLYACLLHTGDGGVPAVEASSRTCGHVWCVLVIILLLCAAAKGDPFLCS